METKNLEKTIKTNGKVEKNLKNKQKPTPKSDKLGMFTSWWIFLKEVKVEMKKVTWPPKKEIFGSTTALIVATLLFGVFLGIVDFILAKGIQPALSGNAGVMSLVTLILFIGILFWIYKSN